MDDLMDLLEATETKGPEPETENALEIMPMEVTEWADTDTGEIVNITVPRGTQLIRVDPTGEAKYLEVVYKVKALCAELNEAKVENGSDKGQVVQLIGTAGKLTRMIEAHRKTYTSPIDGYKAHLQSIFKKGLLDPLVEAKNAANGEVDAWDAKVRREQAERDRQIEAARLRAEAESIGVPPDELPFRPPPPPQAEVPFKTVTEAGTHFSKKQVTWTVTDIAKLPEEYTVLMPNTKKIQDLIDEKAVAFNEDCNIEIIPGVTMHIAWKGQVRG